MVHSERALATREEEKSNPHHVRYAMATAVATQLPVEWIANRARARLLRRALQDIADRYHVVVPRAAMKILSQVPAKNLPMIGGAVALAKVPMIGRAARWAVLPVVAADATELFARLVLFESYCRDLHTGVSIHPQLATRIHDTIGVTIADMPPQLMRNAKAAVKTALVKRADVLGEAIKQMPGISRFTGGAPSGDPDDVVPEPVEFDVADAPLEVDDPETQEILETQGRILRLLNATSQQIANYKSSFERFLQDSFRVRWKRDE